MQKIRKQVFETNSSSTHSLVLELAPKSCKCPHCKGHDAAWDTLPVVGGVCTIKADDDLFGAEDTVTKAAACLCYVKKVDESKLKMLTSVIKDHTGAKEVKFIPLTDPDQDSDQSPDQDSDYAWGNLGVNDYDNGEVLEEVFKDKATLRKFIFDKYSRLWVNSIEN